MAADITYPGSSIPTTLNNDGGIDFVQQIHAEMRKDTMKVMTRINALAPISRLPPEVMGIIFAMHAWRGEHFDRKWFEILRVCTRWRDIGVGNATLWTHIESRSQGTRYVQEMLQRSKRAPLSLRYTYWNGNDSVLWLFMSCLSRVRQLDLDIIGSTTVDTFFSQLDTSMPFLQKFQITYRSTAVAVKRRLPRAPQLQKLAVSGVSIAWESLNFPRLVKLVVIAHEPSNRPTTHQFLEVLSSSPALEMLHFCRQIPRKPQDTRDRVPIVNLPRLRFIWLADSLSNCAYALDLLSFPSSVNLHLTSYINHDNFDLLVGLLSRFVPNEKTSLSPSLLRFDHDLDGNTGLYIYSSSFPGHRAPKLFLNFRHSASGEDLETCAEILDRLLGDVIQVSKVERLEVQNTSLPFRFWMALFRKLVALPSIIFDSATGIPSKSLIYSLGRNPITARIPLPSVKSLTLSFMDFEDGPCEPDKHSILCLLVHWLKCRKEQGMMLSKLVVMNCTRISREMIAELEEHVGGVSWDGVSAPLIIERTDWDYSVYVT